MNIAVIGGGSAYCPGLIREILKEADLFRGCRFVLVDIDAENLDIVHRLGRRMIASAGAEIELDATTERPDALENAGIVLTTFRAGGFSARHLDESIPLRHRVIGHETVGPGGFFMALRTVPIIREITDDMERICPDAVLLNYTNPTSIVTEAVSRFSRANVIGMCDQPMHDARLAAGFAGVEGDLEFEAAGLNHASWGVLFKAGGRDVVPVLASRLDEVEADDAIPEKEKRMCRLAATYGLLPSQYLQYYYFRDECVDEAIEAPKTRAQEIMDELDPIFDGYREQSEADHPVLGLVRGGSAFGDLAVDVMSACIHDSGAVHILNIPNRGTIPEWGDESVVEIPVRVGRSGAVPIHGIRLPERISGPLRMLASYQSLTAAAAWSGTRNDAVIALASNPLILSLSMAGRIYDEMAAAHAQHLPERLLT